MKKLFITFIFLSSVVVSTNSVAEWSKWNEDTFGNTFYLDFDRIRKIDGYIYFWYLVDFKNITKNGELSAETLQQGDCKLLRYKILTQSVFNKSMGKGNPKTRSTKNQEWKYARPNTLNEKILELICNQ